MALPESPRWLILKGKEDEAMVVLSALADLPPEDAYVRAEFAAIKDTVLEMQAYGYKDLFTMGPDRHFHRVVLAYVNQMFQQISGINLITCMFSLFFFFDPLTSYRLCRNNLSKLHWPLPFPLTHPCRGKRYRILRSLLDRRIHHRTLRAPFTHALRCRGHVVIYGRPHYYQLLCAEQYWRQRRASHCRGLLIYFQHVLRHWLARYDLALPCGNRPFEDSSAGECIGYKCELVVQFHGRDDHTRGILFHRLPDLHHLRRHQRLHRPRRLLLLPRNRLSLPRGNGHDLPQDHVLVQRGECCQARAAALRKAWRTAHRL